MSTAWDRAVETEARRCRRMGMIPQQSDGSDYRTELLSKRTRKEGGTR